MFGTVQVDLPTWWAGTARDGVGPAITGQGKQVVMSARGTVAVAPARGGRWQVTVDVTLRGRGLLRPFVSPALEVPLLLTKRQDELRDLITKELTGAPGS